MENMKKLCTRNFFLPLLALIMCVGLVSTPAFAADVDGTENPAVSDETVDGQETNGSDESYVDGEDPDADTPEANEGSDEDGDETDDGQVPATDGDTGTGDDKEPAEGGDETGDGEAEEKQCTCGAEEGATHDENCPLHEEPTEGEDPAEEPKPAVCNCTEKCGEDGNAKCDVCRADAGACKATSSGVKWDADTGTLTVTGNGGALNAANLTLNGEAITNLKPTHLVIDGFSTVGSDFNAMTGGLQSLKISNVGTVGNQALRGIGNDGLTVTIENSKLDNWALYEAKMSTLELVNVDASWGSLGKIGSDDQKVKLSVRGGHLRENALVISKLSEVVLSDGVTIYAETFGVASAGGMTSADKVTVNGGSLGGNAFSGITMSEVELNGVDIATDAFTGANSDKVTVNGGNLGWKAFQGFTMSEVELNNVIIGNNTRPFAGASADKVTITNSTVGDWAFYESKMSGTEFELDNVAFIANSFSGANASTVTIKNSELVSGTFNGFTASEVVLDNVTADDWAYPLNGTYFDTVTVKNGITGSGALGACNMSNLVLDNVTVEGDNRPFAYTNAGTVTINGGSFATSAFNGCNMSELVLNKVTINDGVSPFEGAGSDNLKVTVNNSELGYWALGSIKASEVELNNTTAGNSIFVWTTNDLKVYTNNSNLTPNALDDGNIILYVENGKIIKQTIAYLQDLIDKSEGPTKLVISGVIHGTSDSKSICIRKDQDITLVADENGATIEAADQFNKSLFVIEEGGKLTIDDENLTLKGATNANPAMYAATVFDVNGELNLNNGTIKGGSTTNKNDSSLIGAIAVRSGAKFTMTGGTITDTNFNNHMGAPVVVWSGAEFLMSGGKITNNRNSGSNSAGAVMVHNGERDDTMPAKMTLTGTAEISHNEAAYGGIALVGHSELYMDGGKITYNKASTNGGGISVAGRAPNLWPYDAKCVLIMNGGEISGNYAEYGGGIYSNSNYVTLNAGLIANNTAGKIGGGVYVETPDEKISVPHSAHLSNAVIYHNTATVMGGGMYFCPTGTGILTGSEAVFDNEAGGAADDFVSVVGWYDKSATITELMLGGGTVEWYRDGRVYEASDRGPGTVDEAVARYLAENAELLEAGKYDYSIALKAVATENAKAQALMNATLIITGNTAERGGGVGSNGNVTTGNFGPEDPEEHSVAVNKVWSDIPQTEQKPVIIQLVLDGYALDKTLVLNAENNWTAAFEGLYQIAKDTGNIKIKELTTGYSVSYSEVTVSEDGKILSITVTNSPAPVDPDPTPDPTPDPDPEPDPDPDPEVEIPDVDVPLAEPDIEPEPEVEIPDVDVPLSDVPQTGDNSGIWYVLAALSVSGLAVLALVEKRKEQEG